LPLQYGKHRIEVPVVLAPMAGITNTAFRRLCREHGGGLFISEMITSRALVERTPESMRLIQHHPSEEIRSIQLYGVDPKTISDAVKMLVAEDRADHIDLNFGCPVPKVTRKGGGAALPWKQELFSAIVHAAVRAAGDVPVSVKMRKGIDDNHLTYLDAGKAARDAGVVAVALHARTAEEYYSGRADWSAIGFVADAFYRHAELLTEFFSDEGRACRDIRKHVAWYFKGYPVGGEFRAALALANSLAEIAEILETIDRSLPYPGDDAEGPRGRLGGAKSCSLPENWLDSRDLSDTHRSQLQLAELSVSGG